MAGIVIPVPEILLRFPQQTIDATNLHIPFEEDIEHPSFSCHFPTSAICLIVKIGGKPQMITACALH
jgi:hypothetical protein